MCSTARRFKQLADQVTDKDSSLLCQLIFERDNAFAAAKQAKANEQHLLNENQVAMKVIHALCKADSLDYTLVRGANREVDVEVYSSRVQADMRRWFINLPDQDLAYIPDGSELFKDYMAAIDWAQKFARLNRETMMAEVLGVLHKLLPDFKLDKQAINCHHNYVARENHFGANVLVTRKGAVRARVGDLGIIPGSMGARSYIVQGKGNADAFHSCSHGAGRAMSRNEARKKFTIEDHIKATEGVECRKDAEVIDETPAAYKNIDAVMEAQRDLVDIVHTLRQIVCVKG